MPKPTEATSEIKQTFDQYCIDNNLTVHEAYLLSQKKPKKIAAQVTGLQKFSNKVLGNSLRTVRAEKIVEANMQYAHPKTPKKSPVKSLLFSNAPRPPMGSSAKAHFTTTPSKKKRRGSDMEDDSNYMSQPSPVASHSGDDVAQHLDMTSLSLYDPNYKNYSFGAFLDFEECGGPLNKNISKDSAYYDFLLSRGFSTDPQQIAVITKESAHAEGSLEKVIRGINEDDVAHDYLLAEKQKRIAQLKAELEEEEREHNFLAHRKLMTTGKARAFVYVAKKGLNNINSAIMMSDKTDLMEVAKNKKKWIAELKEDQELMMNGEAKAIQVILAKIQAEPVQN